MSQEEAISIQNRIAHLERKIALIRVEIHDLEVEKIRALRRGKTVKIKGGK